MFKVGDVVRFHSPTAGKEKFHICLGYIEGSPVFAFLHLNSSSGYRGDCILDDGRVPGLPVSATGQTIVSFSSIVRIREDRLATFRAVKTASIDSLLAGELAAFAKDIRVLTAVERKLVVTALESLF